MNRWMRAVVSGVSLTSALALLPASVALADDGASQAPQAGSMHGGEHRHDGHRHGLVLVGKALRLDSLTPAQRSTIQGLAQTQRSAWTPVRQADAAVLTQLAQGVERGSVDRDALSPELHARETAAASARTASHEVRSQLQAALTPSQWEEITAHGSRPDGGAREGAREAHGERGPARIARFAQRLNLTPAQTQTIEATMAAAHGHGMVDLVAAAAPVLTPAQRVELAGHLRLRASHESRG
jgi:Spy/CpxP family protein refolding chaperone